MGYVEAAAGSCADADQQSYSFHMGSQTEQAAGVHSERHSLPVVTRGCVLCACAALRI